MDPQQQAAAGRWVPLGEQTGFSGSGSNFAEVFESAGSDLVVAGALLKANGIEVAWDPFDPVDLHPTREVMLRTFTLLVHPENLAEARELLLSLQEDDPDLEKLAEEQYLTPWTGPGGAAGKAAARDAASESGFASDHAAPDADDNAPRDEHGDYLFASDRRAAEERSAAAAEGADEEQGSLVGLVIILGIIAALLGMFFMGANGLFGIH
ncbi:MAG TPA: hypothetical protein VFG89_10125 [Coriobacteriia bacterium]|nr:hypothetical protein [Coriobacteriia bacterium]